MGTKHTEIRRTLAACALAAAIGHAGSAPAAEARPRATVSPEANSKSASIYTEISFRGIRASRAGAIAVHGNRSGRHAYRRRSHSDHRGFSLVMKRPFLKAERITVKTRLMLPGTRHGKLRFRVENLGGARIKRLRNARVQRGGSRVFHSRPDLRPFTLRVRTRKKASTDEPIFIASKKRGSAIFDAAGKPIWFKPMRSTDFRTQTYRGKPVLTWFQAPSRGSGLRRASYIIANRSYRVIKRIVPGNGYSADSHEFRLTPRGTAYITSFRTMKRDLRPVGLGRDGRVSDSIAQEIDLATGRVIWEWHSLDRVPVRQSYARRARRRGNPLDYFHINSVIDTPDGNVLVSGRSTSTIYKISRRTGRIIWRLGGKKSDFKLGRRARFSWQHDAEPLSGDRISLFDNSDAPVAKRPSARQSRGLILKLDKGRRRATISRQFFHPAKPLSPTQANLESLPGGNVFIGWGQRPFLSEYSAGGTLLFDARVMGAFSFYRAYRLPWSGHPRGRVAIATRSANGSTTAWVSWNGDTEVKKWRAFTGFSPSLLKPARTVRRGGFETRIHLPNQDPYIRVVGLSAAGRPIGHTRVAIVR